MGCGLCPRQRTRCAIDFGRTVESHTWRDRAVRGSNWRCASSQHSRIVLRRCTCGCSWPGICLIIPSWHLSWSDFRPRSHAQVWPSARERVQGQRHPRRARPFHWPSRKDCTRRTQLGRIGSGSVPEWHWRRSSCSRHAGAGRDCYAEGETQRLGLRWA